MTPTISIIIMAAGDGKRMQSDLPKMLHPLHGQPLIGHVVSNVESTQLGKPVVIVSAKHTLVQDYIGDRAEYAVQQEQLGTGHAVLQAQPLLHSTADHVVVLNGDMPLVSSSSIRLLVDEHLASGSTITMMTATVDSFEGENVCFARFGRIIRNSSGYITRITEAKDCTEAELLIREVNTSAYCFKAEWLWHHLQFLQNTTNVQKEYYLTDLIEIALNDHQPISSISITARESMGVNSKEDLQALETLIAAV